MRQFMGAVRDADATASESQECEGSCGFDRLFVQTPLITAGVMVAAISVPFDWHSIAKLHPADLCETCARQIRVWSFQADLSKISS